MCVESTLHTQCKQKYPANRTVTPRFLCFLRLQQQQVGVNLKLQHQRQVDLARDLARVKRLLNLPMLASLTQQQDQLRS